jgi:hypothetical protein
MVEQQEAERAAKVDPGGNRHADRNNAPSPHSTLAAIIASIVALIVGISWPATLILLIIMAYSHFPTWSTITDTARTLFRDRTVSEVEASMTKEGFKLRLQMVASGLAAQSRTADGKDPVSPSVATQLSAEGVTKVEARKRARAAKILWVDPHPTNNIGLQYAFQALEIIVVSVQDDDGIEPAFRVAENFDVVITNMVRERSGQQSFEAGLRTVEIIKTMHPGVPVIIYSGVYGEKHRNEVQPPPILLATNVTQDVFTKVTEIVSGSK